MQKHGQKTDNLTDLPGVKAGEALVPDEGALAGGAGDGRRVLPEPLLCEDGEEGGGEAEDEGGEPQRVYPDVRGGGEGC